MNLVIDVGNTKLSFGFFENGKLLNYTNTRYFKTSEQTVFNTILHSVTQDYNINNCVIASVADEVTQKISEAALLNFKTDSLIINTDMELGIKILSKNLGIDRIANAVAATRLYKERPIIVVDCGTATTFDIVNDKEVFIGGLIMPGLFTQLKSLSEDASRLPLLNLNMMDKVTTVINNETDKAILSGIVNSHAIAIQGLIYECEKELKSTPFVIGTGGDAKFISKYMTEKGFDAINTNLTLEGINMIYELNKD